VRAAETGRPAVQAALTGDTVAFDARGRLLALMPAQQRGVTVVRLGLPPAAARTLYDRLGDYVPWAATGIAAVAAITGFLMVRRARGGRVPWDGNPRRARSVSTVGASSGKCREGQH
jgi:apolipoprotein N-acyltransferase